MKTFSIWRFGLFVLLALLTGCSVNQYSVSEQKSVCVDFAEKSVGYAVEVMAVPSQADSMISLQVVKTHSHQLANLQGREVSTYRNTAQREALGTSFLALLLAGMGVALDMLIFVWIAGLCILPVWIIAFINPEYSVPVTKGYLIETKQSVTNAPVSCPITYLYPVEKSFVLSCNGIQKEIKSDRDGRITLNFIHEFGFRGKEMPSKLVLGVRSDELNINDSISMSNLRSSLPNGPPPSANNPAFETPRQYLLAEQFYWNTDSRNNPNELSKGTYYLPDAKTRKATLDMIGNQRLLRTLLKSVRDLDERKLIFSKLYDESLVCLSRLSDDPAIALACMLKTNQVNWPAMFSSRSTSASDLRNIVRSAALIDSPLPAASDIVGVCHKYIRMGDESSIPELRSLLLRFGDQPLAEDYLNCGNSRLAAAAEEWGRARGKIVKTGQGSHRVSWGEGK